MCTGEGGGPEQAAAEARALFVGPIDYADRQRWASVILLCETAQDFEGGHQVEAAVQPAAVGHRIQVTAEQ